MSRRKRLHRRLYARVGADGKVRYEWPSEKVVGTGKWLDNGGGKGATVTLPSKRR